MNDDTTGLGLYTRTAEDVAARVISAYSTSFSLATRLLGPRVRRHVRNVYALVRVADEIVDGPGAEAGLDAAQLRALLDAFEAETVTALACGFSANPVVHAFSRTARECGIGEELTGPFFASMRTDLATTAHDSASHDDYVYGSAEAVGLMCLAVFVNAGASRPVPPREELVSGARALGRAFQDVNFLRDRGADQTLLGRDYLSGLGAREQVLDRIDADLEHAASVIAGLPADCRAAVTAAHDLFAALSIRLRRSTGERRVRVPDPLKAALAAGALLGKQPTRMARRSTGATHPGASRHPG